MAGSGTRCERVRYKVMQSLGSSPSGSVRVEFPILGFGKTNFLELDIRLDKQNIKSPNMMFCGLLKYSSF